MPSATVSHPMPCSSAVVFELLHDYDRRLEWDTLLREARLTRGCTVAKKGATSLCVGEPLFGWIGVETRYLTFVPGSIAAVEMINRPPFFEHFAASIRHEDAAEGSLLTYKLNFTARPRFLRWLLDPIMLVALRYETRKRLAALAEFLGKEGQSAR
ncbi:MAG: SRPBCC family protein [Verrucomicrobiaceae bacterium]|nr:MAG: SRPBCC family protein [Verrucomicrobiaceae bacterium]